MKYFTLLLVVIFSTSSVYSQWQLQSSSTTENLNDVAILNQTTAIVVGNNGIILKTTNSGTDWSSKISGTTNQLNAVSFRDEENGIAVGNQVICRTTNNGENWNITSVVENLSRVSYREPFFDCPILIGSSNGRILFSWNDGNSWCDTLIYPNEPIIAVGFHYYSPHLNEPLALTATTNYTASDYSPCSSWGSIENPINPVWDILTGGEFYNWNQYLVGWNGNPGPIPIILRRISFTLWETIYSFVSEPYIPNDIKALNEILFVCGSEGKIYNSTDRGDNWIEQITDITANLNAIDIINDTIGYSVGDNGVILFTSNGGGINSVEEVIEPDRIVLYQNYPNPFNPITNIEYKINSRQHVQLKVFDVLGNEITTLVNEEQPAGSYNAEFDPSLISSTPSSGIYFYQLFTTGEEGHSVQTRKMIYLK